MRKYTYVIPVYNVERYLDECLNSILKQTYKNFEIILVDDGSKDMSGVICDEYAANFPNVSVIHKENGGLSSARNVGLENSRTEYVIFLDSDDYWNDNEGLRKIDELTKDGNLDVIVFASQDYYQDRGQKRDDRYNYPIELNNYEPEECLKYLIEHDLLNMSAAKKVYRREFLIKNQLSFKMGIRSEDIEQGLRLINCLPRYRFLNEKLYTYRHRNGSITTTIGHEHIRDYINIIETYADYNYVNDSVAEYILSYVAYQYVLLLAHITLVKIKKKNEYLKELKKYTYLLEYDKCPRVRLISRIFKIFGFNVTRLALGIYLRTRKV